MFFQAPIVGAMMIATTTLPCTVSKTGSAQDEVTQKEGHVLSVDCTSTVTENEVINISSGYLKEHGFAGLVPTKIIADGGNNPHHYVVVWMPELPGEQAD